MKHTSDRSVTGQAGHSNSHQFGRSFCLGMIGSMIFFLPFFQTMNFERNRYLHFWHWSDSVSFALSVIGLGVILTFIVLPCRALLGKRLLWVGRLAFLLLAVVAICYCVAYSCRDTVKNCLGEKWAVEHRDLLFSVAIGGVLLIVGVVVTLLLRYRFKAESLYRFAVAILIPLPWVCVISALTWSTYATQTDSRGFASGEPEIDAKPVFVILFDAWSFTSLTDEQGVLPKYPNLRAFSNQAINCRATASPWWKTELSLPRLIYQDVGHLSQQSGRLLWNTSEGVVPSDEAPNLFQAAHALNYQTALIGTFHQYERMLGENVDCYGGVYSYYTQTETAIAKPLHWVAESIRVWANALPNQTWTSRVQRWLNRYEWPIGYNRYIYNVGQESLGDVLRLTEQCPPNTFMFVHYVVPHEPYVCAADGSFDHDADYTSQLAYADLVLGRIVEHLQIQKKYRDATIILLADHSNNRSIGGDAREWGGHRIPLFIKLPQQEEGIVFEGLIETQKIQPFLESAMNKSLSKEEAVVILESISEGSSLPEGVPFVP